jgi:hypothetical protein
MKKWVPILFLLCYSARITAQQVPAAVEQQLENLTELAEEETEDDTYLQQLQLLPSAPAQHQYGYGRRAANI